MKGETIRDVEALKERLRAFRLMLSHADAMSLKPTEPCQVETTKITARESQLLQAALADADAILNILSEPGEEVVEAVAKSLHGKLFATITDWRDEQVAWVELPDHARNAFMHSARAAIKAFISEIGGAG
jgi:hypothetical protein